MSASPELLAHSVRSVPAAVPPAAVPPAAVPPAAALLGTVPAIVLQRDTVIGCTPALAEELGVDPAPLLGPLEAIGTRLDDAGFDELCAGTRTLRVRLRAELADRPVRLRRLVADDDLLWVEVRSLAAEFRLESLLRRSGTGHMLLTPDIELLWSMSANELSDVFPGDNPLNWVELMDPDDMQTLGKAIYKVGRDPSLRRTVQHRLNADRTYTIIDTVESAVHDPDLRAVLVRSHLADAEQSDPTSAGAAPYAGITVSDHMPIGVLVASSHGKVLHRNAVAAALLDARAGSSVAPDGDDWLLAALAPEHATAFAHAFRSAAGGSGAAHCTVPSPVDQQRWLRISASPAAASTVVVTIEDMTELVAAERALRASNRLLEALDSHSEDLVIVFGDDGEVRYSSSSVRERLGSTAIIRPDDLLAHVHPDDHDVVAALQRRVEAGPVGSEELELRVIVAPAGTTGGDTDPSRWHRATVTNLLRDPDVGGIVLTLRDVHERHLAERELRYRATHDALTALPGRASLLAALDAIVRDASGSQRRTGVIFCDVDRFKLVNDRYGHAAGDLVLTQVAQRLRAALRTSDLVGRFGGDEFVMVICNVDDEDDALALAERAFRSVSGPAECGDGYVDISVSMGVAVTDAVCSTPVALLERADMAMYRAKRAGRGRISMYAPEIPEAPADATATDGTTDDEPAR